MLDRVSSLTYHHSHHGRVAGPSSDGVTVFKTMGQSIARGTCLLEHFEPVGQHGEISALWKQRVGLPDLIADNLNTPN